MDDLKLNLIFYGEPGSGKTWLASSFATMDAFKPCLYIDCGGQVISLRRWNKESFEPLFVRPKTLADLKNLLGLLQNKEAFIKSNIGKELGAYPELIIVDTMSEVQRIMADAIAGVEGKSLEPAQLRLRDYGTLSSQTLSFVRGLNNLGTNTIYTYWSYQRITETSTEPRTVQLLGSARDMVLAYANYAGYLTTVGQLDTAQRRRLRLKVSPSEENKRILIHSNTKENKGKDQLFSDGSTYIVNPTVADFVKIFATKQH